MQSLSKAANHVAHPKQTPSALSPTELTALLNPPSL